MRSCSFQLSALVILVASAVVVWHPQVITSRLNLGSRVFYDNPTAWRADAEVLLGADTLAEVQRDKGITSCRLTVINVEPGTICSAMAEIDRKGRVCARKEPDRELIRATFPTLKEISKREMLLLIDACGQVEEVIRDDSASGWSYSPRNLVLYPGTLWCGVGDRAANYSELGTSRETDRCCRNHDFCPVKIYAGERKFGIELGFLQVSSPGSMVDLVDQRRMEREKNTLLVGRMNVLVKDVCTSRLVARSWMSWSSGGKPYTALHGLGPTVV
ncbi:hypothetical protein BIW11_04681 [Tropilaelaps mercedesae]|uniref:Phospholipase A2-like central domain-containing protein n=1 Tax=Tropilaelaps mercedesae TaxID=418985 RepID=A0A1V9X2K4_9ACAR|nr:hypothetical protein BIW11_04681 [Tropilaelaps mercedesae]